MKIKTLLSQIFLILILGSGQIFANNKGTLDVAADEDPVLLLHYSFEGDLMDGSGNGNDAKATGTSGVPVYGEAEGLKGKYLDLSGNTDNAAAALFISTPDSLVKSADDAYTITGWAKINTLLGRMQILNQPSSGNVLSQFLMKWSQTEEQAWISGTVAGGSWYHSSPDNMYDWFHFALVVDPANDTMDIWYDGVHKKGVSQVFSDTIAPVFFGATPWGSEANDGFFDEIYVYKGKLSAEDIGANMAAAGNVVLYYGFEDELSDGSGNGNHAIAMGTSSLPVYGDADGLNGKYLDLSGNTDNAAAALFISTPDSLLKSADAPYTITGWAKINTLLGRMQILNQPSSGNVLSQFLMKWSQTEEQAWISGSVAGGSWYHSSPDNMYDWFHFALVVDPANDTMDIWYDGVHRKGVSQVFSDTIAPLFFGATPWGSEANDGFFDEIYVYNELLSGQEIMESYMAFKRCDPIDVSINNDGSALWVSGMEGAVYQWINCADGSPIPEATDTLYMPSASGEFKVAVTLSEECTDTSECSAITICDPIDVSVMVSETELYVNAMEGATYQWIDCADGSEVTGATDASYAPEESGEFKVAITLSAECTDTSECTSFTITTGTEQITGQEFDVYPNPVKDILSIDLGTHADGALKLINTVGQTVLLADISDQHIKVDMSAMKSGIYLLKVTIENRSSVLRIVKQ